MHGSHAFVVFAAFVSAAEAARVSANQGSTNAAAATTSTSTTTSKAGNFNAGLFDNIQVINYDISWAADYNLGYTGRAVTAGDATVKDNDSGYPSCQTTAGGDTFLSGTSDYSWKQTGRGRRLSEGACSTAPGGYISFPSSTVSDGEAIAEFELDATTTICGFRLGAESANKPGYMQISVATSTAYSASKCDAGSACNRCLNEVTPSMCPDDPDLGNCDDGDLFDQCEADGECSTNTGLDNCGASGSTGNYDLYRWEPAWSIIKYHTFSATGSGTVYDTVPFTCQSVRYLKIKFYSSGCCAGGYLAYLKPPEFIGAPSPPPPPPSPPPPSRLPM